MESRLIDKLKLQYLPVAFLMMDEKPADVLEAREGVWTCVVPFFRAAAKGKMVVFSRKTTTCLGGKVGMGFGNAYMNFPGGIEYFLSAGKEGFREGEGYIKTPELAKDFVDNLPITDIPSEYVVLKPVTQVNPESETPVLVSFYVNMDQLSALTVLANYNSPGIDRVRIPFGAGCQSLFILPLDESKNETPKAVVGLLDVTVRPMVDKNYVSFTVPYQMFLEMEQNISGSFLEKENWSRVRERITE